MDFPTKVIEIIQGVAVLKTNNGDVCQCPVATQYPTQAKIAGGGIQFIANPCTSNCPLFQIKTVPVITHIEQFEQTKQTNLYLCNNVTYYDVKVVEAAKPPIIRPLGSA
jgi:hypothetical protein